MKQPLIIIGGPTAVGKTALSISLAKELNGEIISGDSMQVYRGMDIGTAKIMPNEMQGIVHHLIDIKDPKEGFTASEFKDLATKAIREIAAKGKIPIIVGGTGLYLSSVIYGYQFANSVSDEEYRTYLTTLAENNGNQILMDLLKECDPVAAEKLHLNDTKRLIRALEVFHVTGKSIYDNYQGRNQESPYEICFIVLDMDRARLYQRINQRVDVMLEQGWIDEVKRLLADGLTPTDVAMQGLGYKQLANYLLNHSDYVETVETIKKETRHFAKRQLTWFRHDKNVHWLIKDNKTDDMVLQEAFMLIKENLSLF